jgi:hypothetical protein
MFVYDLWYSPARTIGVITHAAFWTVFFYDLRNPSRPSIGTQAFANFEEIRSFFLDIPLRQRAARFRKGYLNLLTGINDTEIP